MTNSVGERCPSWYGQNARVLNAVPPSARAAAIALLPRSTAQGEPHVLTKQPEFTAGQNEVHDYPHYLLFAH